MELDCSNCFLLRPDACSLHALGFLTTPVKKRRILNKAPDSPWKDQCHWELSPTGTTGRTGKHSLAARTSDSVSQAWEPSHRLSLRRKPFDYAFSYSMKKSLYKSDSSKVSVFCFPRLQHPSIPGYPSAAKLSQRSQVWDVQPENGSRNSIWQRNKSASVGKVPDGFLKTEDKRTSTLQLQRQKTNRKFLLSFQRHEKKPQYLGPRSGQK